MAPQIKQAENEIKSILSSLLQEGKVELAFGFTKGHYSDEITPYFINQEKAVANFVLNRSCHYMLSKYLLQHKEKKVAIVTKPCDNRALVFYLAEGLLKKEKLVIISLDNCPGMEGMKACDECEVKEGVIADYRVDLAGDSNLSPPENPLEKLTNQERFKYFQKEFKRCIRCYACREACYVCACPECFSDSNQPFWLGAGSGLRDNFTFHLMRSIHMAGRCNNCGACERACPEQIDVRALVAHLYRFSADVFDYKVGMSLEQKSLFTDYRLDDKEIGFIE